MEFTFTLKYQLNASELDSSEIVEKLGAAGCDDALVGTGVAGRVALEFTRESRSAREAMRSAMVDVKRALPNAELVEVGPELVGLTEIAEIAGVSRQAVRKLMLTHPHSFPSPLHDGSTSIWHLNDVLLWLAGRGYALDAALLQVSSAAMEVNLRRESRRLREFERRSKSA